MSKLYEKYKYLKAKNQSNLYLFKSGIFYIFLEEDAKLMSNMLGLKLTNLNETVVKCGFPIQNIDKYLKIIKNSNYTVEILNSPSSDPISDETFSLTNDIKDFLIKLSKINSETMSIREAFSTLDEISNTAKDFIGNLFLKN